MLQNIRDNSQGWLTKTAICIIIVLLVLTSIEAIFHVSTENSQSVVEVNGEAITKTELSRAIDIQRYQLMQQIGKDFKDSLLDETLLREVVLKMLIDRKLLLQGAADLKLSFSEAMLDKMILETPEFQVDNKFSAKRFDLVIRQLGYSRMQFRQMQAEEMLISQLRRGIINSSFVTDVEVLAFARLEKQTRSFNTMSIKADPTTIKLTDDEVKVYYNQYAKEFMTQDEVIIDYIELNKPSFFNQVTVSNYELQVAYQKEIAKFAEQRHAAHILIEVNEKTTNAQAKAKIEEIQTRLNHGDKFEDIANDPGVAKNSGDLGLISPGVYDSNFETALYALNKDQISPPVRTTVGWHLIKLLGIKLHEAPTFASLKDKLTSELKSKKVEQRYVEAIKQLEDGAFKTFDLDQLASDLRLTVHTFGPFSRKGGEGLAANRNVINAAFSREVLYENANSTAIALNSETTIVLRAKEHLQPKQLPLDSAAPIIRARMIKERANAAAKINADKLIASLRNGKILINQPIDSQVWTMTKSVSRNAEELDPNLLQAIFRMPKPIATNKPTLATVEMVDGSLLIVRLHSVNEVAAITAEEKLKYRRLLASRSGHQDFAVYCKQLEAKANIKKF
ncbi:SurA N-terminal domain-containing protein [Candidatus Pseudomonas adelgestsugas]|uniref:Periplasmic chaperone PpiD n=1 Tax=Candidatus Pseudomonas adelgestsugas TaxID=1302376 RepID=A0ABX5R9F3_9PSED|nr:SurA N-terminal domain-containing protein [Candidatus Pseudomonas adelgestsugas]QAX81933.1 Peptidyl-prolyl cis-trans isomerase D [Candidatus Pseudomonas adelgestsugas]